MIVELVKKCRSIRRFDESRKITRDELLDLVDLGRVTASGANKQPLKYLVYADQKSNDAIYPHTSWAGYLTDWDGPVEGERPVAYIVMLLDTEISETVDCDHGIAAQTIALAAMERGIGCCMISALKRVPLKRDLGITEQYKVQLVLALGYPAESVVLEEARDGDIKYWRDDSDVHHVPKRPLDEVVLN